MAGPARREGARGRASAAAGDDGRAYPVVPWAGYSAFLNRRWERGEHCSIIAPSNEGKTWLITRGLLPLWAHERWCYFDSKDVLSRPARDDPSVKGVGRRVASLPKSKRERNKQRHFRLILSRDRTVAKGQAVRAIDTMIDDGDWVVVFDEAANLFGFLQPSLGLAGYGQDLYQRARSWGITVIGATQSPRNVPHAFYSEPTYLFLGAVENDDDRKALRAIDGMDARMLTALDGLEQRQYVGVAKYPEPGVRKSRVITKVETASTGLDRSVQHTERVAGV